MNSRARAARADDFELPKEWSRHYSEQHKRHYFVNSELRLTSWVDPRDKFWKKATWQECADPNETPFGWEIAFDPVVGTYFIDHLRLVNILDDPRSDVPQRELAALKTLIAQQNTAYSEKSALLRAGLGKLAQVDGKIEALRAREKEAIKKCLRFDEMKAIGDALESEARLREVLERETAQLKDAVATLRRDVTELGAVIERLEQENADQLETHKRLQQEIGELAGAIAAEEATKAALEREFARLKEMLQRGDGPPAANGPPNAPAARAESNEQPPPPPQQQQQRMTRIEREVEALSLRRELERQRDETAALRQLSERAKAEVARALEAGGGGAAAGVRDWITQLNNYAALSATIRVRSKERGQRAGEDMSFRDKMVLFAANQHGDAALREVVRRAAGN